MIIAINVLINWSYRRKAFINKPALTFPAAEFSMRKIWLEPWSYHQRLNRTEYINFFIITLRKSSFH